MLALRWDVALPSLHDARTPREIHRPKLDDGRKGGFKPSPALDHRAEILGAHLGDHGTLRQGYKTYGQRARVPVGVLTDATTQEFFEPLEGKVRVVNKDDKMVVKPSGGAAGVDVVVGGHVLLIPYGIHVAGVEHVFTPVDVAGLVLPAQGAVSHLHGVVRHGDFEAVYRSKFLTNSD